MRTASFVLLSFLYLSETASGQTIQTVQRDSASMRHEDTDILDRVRSDAFKTPCLSASISPEQNPAGLVKREFQARAELRFRAAGIQPTSWDVCEVPERHSEFITSQALSKLFISTTAYVREDGTFTVDLIVFRVVAWRVSVTDVKDDGYRAALLEVWSDHEPTYSPELHRTPVLRHEGRAANVFDTFDRMMDRFLLRYLKANSQGH